MTRRHSPTEEDRRTVKALSGYGVPQEDIAIHMDMDAKTLRKHYRRELDRGTIEANAKVAQTLFTVATVDKNVAAAIFWMKARGGWREKPLPDEEVRDEKLTVVIKRFTLSRDEINGVRPLSRPFHPNVSSRTSIMSDEPWPRRHRRARLASPVQHRPTTVDRC